MGDSACRTFHSEELPQSVRAEGAGEWGGEEEEGGERGGGGREGGGEVRDPYDNPGYGQVPSSPSLPLPVPPPPPPSPSLSLEGGRDPLQ